MLSLSYSLHSNYRDCFSVAQCTLLPPDGPINFFVKWGRGRLLFPLRITDMIS